MSADWSSPEARWHVVAQCGGSRVELTCGFLFSCTGYYRYDHGYTPDFAGMDRFGGTIVHPQAWPEDLDVTGEQVVVIGKMDKDHFEAEKILLKCPSKYNNDKLETTEYQAAQL